MLNNCNYFHTSPPNDNFTLFLPFVNGVRETGRRRKLVHCWPFLMLSRKLFYFHVDWLMLMPMPVVNRIRVLNTFFQIFGIIFDCKVIGRLSSGVSVDARMIHLRQSPAVYSKGSLGLDHLRMACRHKLAWLNRRYDSLHFIILLIFCYQLLSLNFM